MRAPTTRFTMHKHPGMSAMWKVFRLIQNRHYTRHQRSGPGILRILFSIIDGALLKLWKHLGRSAQSFLNRVVLDHKLCYLGNADIDSVLRITLRSWRKVGDPGHEVSTSCWKIVRRRG